MPDSQPLLRLDKLSIAFGDKPVLKELSLEVRRGETLALVGESGSGKSVSALGAMNLLPDNADVSGGRWLGETDLAALKKRQWQSLLGRRVGFVFQEPMTSLNPLHTIAKQIGETLRLHQGLSGRAARERSRKLLEQVKLPRPDELLDAWPHQLSGGQRQRVMIAMAIANDPELLIADEPTTALDVSVQAQILALLKRLCADHGTAVMLVTHDMGVIAETADRVAVMYAGRLIEIGPVDEVIRHPQHPYTKGLMASIPGIAKRLDRLYQIEGAMPRLAAIPSGCAFNPRCPHAQQRCRDERPDLMPAGGSRAACWLHDPVDPLPPRQDVEGEEVSHVR